MKELPTDTTPEFKSSDLRPENQYEPLGAADDKVGRPWSPPLHRSLHPDPRDAASRSDKLENHISSPPPTAKYKSCNEPKSEQ